MSEPVYMGFVIFLALLIVRVFHEAAKERRRFRSARVIARIQNDGSIEVQNVRL